SFRVPPAPRRRPREVATRRQRQKIVERRDVHGRCVGGIKDKKNSIGQRAPRVRSFGLINRMEAIVKIVEIREKTIPISSPIRNAYIDFSKMTLSLVAVITDVIRDGRPVVGYGFNSNGRYGQGQLMRERFLPRVTE